MALSDVIKKIEDSPRSTKVAAGVAGIAVASTIAVFVVMNNQADSGPEPASVAKAVDESPNTQTDPAPSAPQPAPTAVPTNTPAPIPTSTPEPVPTATPRPTAIPTPVATPTPKANDYYVLLHQGGVLGDDHGVIVFYASYPEGDRRGSAQGFYNEAFYLEYLRKEGIITSEQKKAYFDPEVIEVPLIPISNATYKLFQIREHGRRISVGETLGLAEHTERMLLYYADKSLDHSESVSNVEDLLAGSDGGSITISDGKISVSTVDDDGNTTTVQLEGIGAKELLEYWLSQNRVTVQQVNQYGQTGQVQISLKDGVDLFNFAQSSDGGASFGLDKESRDTIVNEILPLFKFGD